VGAFYDMVTNSSFQVPTQGPEASLAFELLTGHILPIGCVFFFFILSLSVYTFNERAIWYFLLSLIWKVLANLRNIARYELAKRRFDFLLARMFDYQGNSLDDFPIAISRTVLWK
jgi:hypothetical protein